VDLLLGLDVGTTATKALLFDLKGNVVASASYKYDLLTPHKGWVEQDAEELWCGVAVTSRAVLRQVGDGHRVVALGLSSQAGTTIPVGADGQPTYNAFSWMDHRADEQAQRVREEWGADFIYRTTGWRLGSGLPLQHIAWFRENRPDDFAATRHFLFVNDFIVYRLTGRLCMNPSDAGITQLMDIAMGDWDERLLDMAGIQRDHLSPVHPSGHAVGTLTAAAGQATGLSQDVLVVNGAHDQYCAAVGAGVTRPGHVLLSCGTAWVILAVPESREVGLQSGMAVGRHAVEGRWGAMRSLGGVGTSLEWLLDNAWEGADAGGKREGLYDAVNRGVSRSSPGAGGLLFFPLAGGHARAIGTSRGGFVGLSLSHTRDDMARAVMEGTAFELHWALEEMREVGVKVRELRMVGGAAESPAWPQIVADVSGVPVVLPTVKQAASRGAAILAGVGADLFSDPEAGFLAFRGEEMTVAPDADRLERYRARFDAYRAVLQCLASGPWHES
jgi:xylulokinase